ncbi:MAG: ArsR/SmtB family transcription factor [Candidatus Methylomirabilia bacterium]
MKRDDRQIYKLQAEVCKALANPVRLEILHLIGTGEVSFSELLSSLRISKTNLSQHLAVLRKSRIVTDRREGVHSFYRLTYPEIAVACQAVERVLAQHLREIGKQAKVLLRRVG